MIVIVIILSLIALELIDVRDGYSECIGFTSDEIDEFILALYTG